MEFHRNPIEREEALRRYLYRRASAEELTRLEEHYLICDECFAELRAAEMLIHGLAAPVLQVRQVNDVHVVQFTEETQLLADSLHLAELHEAVRLQSDTKVLIDLSKVSRIDSTGLGTLMNCYTHAVKNSGALKLLNPKQRVRDVLSVTRMDTVLETFDDEDTAIKSYQQN